MKIADKIYSLRTAHQMTQTDFAKIAEVTTAAVSAWETGIRDPKLKPIGNICKHFKIDMHDFIDESNDIFDNPQMRFGFEPIPRTRQIPVVGSIACGDPTLAVQTSDEATAAPDFVRCDFALRCKGDSMINARIFDGDMVYIRKQETVDDGDIAAVLIEDEATLKRVRLFPDHIILEPANPMYKPLVFWDAEMQNVKIMGKAVAFTSNIA